MYTSASSGVSARLLQYAFSVQRSSVLVPVNLKKMCLFQFTSMWNAVSADFAFSEIAGFVAVAIFIMSGTISLYGSSIYFALFLFFFLSNDFLHLSRSFSTRFHTFKFWQHVVQTLHPQNGVQHKFWENFAWTFAAFSAFKKVFFGYSWQ